MDHKQQQGSQRAGVDFVEGLMSVIELLPELALQQADVAKRAYSEAARAIDRADQEVRTLEKRLHTARTVSVTLGLMAKLSGKYGLDDNDVRLARIISQMTARDMAIDVIEHRNLVVYTASMDDPITGHPICYVEKY